MASLTACVTSPAPKGWLPLAAKAQAQANGGWISLTCKKTESCGRIDGELIAVGDERMWVLTASGLVDVSRESVANATLATYATGAGQIAGWSALGALSTLSHGAFLIFSAPVWILGGFAATNSETRAGLVRYPQKPLASFRPYARFPQGLPEGLDPAALGPLAVTSAAGRSPAR